MSETTSPTPAREALLLRLYDLFRHSGYHGVSISDISRATGLGKSSLYHHFPGGKEEMAAAVADFALGWLRQTLFAPLAAPGPRAVRIDAMLTTTDALYDGGAEPCLVAAMLLSQPGDVLHGVLARVLAEWVDVLARALEETGVANARARELAVDALVRIEGALIMARAFKDHTVFERALDEVRTALLVA